MKLGSIEPRNVFKYFEEISNIPRGSGNMNGIADYCISFAEKHSLKAIRDDANNVIIYKPASKGYEDAKPVILQGHLDIVCQKTANSNIDFLKDGLSIYTDGDYIKAKGTTLGADNGIAVAMVLAILDDKELPHPAIEAVFTTDEEIGMIGAGKLDFSLLSAKKMINLDAEEDDTVTVSCAGGSDFNVAIPTEYENKNGTEISLVISGLKGGHSGVEINNGRVNSNMLAGRFLNHMLKIDNYCIISINGGDKANAIPNRTEIKLYTENPNLFIKEAQSYLELIKTEISSREPDFKYTLEVCENTDCSVIGKDLTDKLISLLVAAPNGVMDMSYEIEGLVETSLNLGILQTKNQEIIMHFALRSNKKSALDALEEKLNAYFKSIPCKISAFGHYPPWEFKPQSPLRELYKQSYTEFFGTEPKVEALHAGLECGIFASNIKGLDCIAIGPQLFDVHTVNEKLSISSTERIFKLLLKILKNCR